MAEVITVTVASHDIEACDWVFLNGKPCRVIAVTGNTLTVCRARWWERFAWWVVDIFKARKP